MSDDNPPDLGVFVEEVISIDEQVSKYAPWFNGVKHFYTIKILPPRL